MAAPAVLLARQNVIPQHRDDVRLRLSPRTSVLSSPKSRASFHDFGAWRTFLESNISQSPPVTVGAWGRQSRQDNRQMVDFALSSGNAPKVTGGLVADCAKRFARARLRLPTSPSAFDVWETRCISRPSGRSDQERDADLPGAIR
jgi:hypothetical protein